MARTKRRNGNVRIGQREPEREPHGSAEAAAAKARFGELTAERRRLEERAEREISALIATLDELLDLDGEHRRAGERGWVLADKGRDGDLLVVLHGWIGDRLADHVGGRLLRGAEHEKTLADRDPLAEPEGA